MAKFFQVTNLKDDGLIAVNVENVIAIKPFTDKKTGEHTQILTVGHLDNGVYSVYAKETYAQVMSICVEL